MDEAKMIQAAMEAGAVKATLIPQSQVVLSREFRAICEGNGCGNYGRCYMCPPDAGEIDALMGKVRSYPRALLYQTIGTVEDSFDIEGMTAAAVAHAHMSARLQTDPRIADAGKTMHLTCGGCRLCETCAKRTGEPCRHPDQALPSLEGCGIDVYRTVKDTPLKYINGVDTVTFFGMVLFGA